MVVDSAGTWDNRAAAAAGTASFFDLPRPLADVWRAAGLGGAAPCGRQFGGFPLTLPPFPACLRDVAGRPDMFIIDVGPVLNALHIEFVASMLGLSSPAAPSFRACSSSRSVDIPISDYVNLFVSSAVSPFGSLALSASGVAPAWPASPETVGEA